jgi:hypothetical protein
MAVAPLIKPIQTPKGMFYTFQSSLEDLTLTFNNTNKFKFSKFALLRIPEIGIPTTLATDNRTQFLALGESPLLEGLSANQNINLALSFQNYALNFESLLISQAAYQREQKLNVSERVFFKWLKELGAIRWRDATNIEAISGLLSGLSASEARWAEAWGDVGSTTYNRVVKYIADIDVINSVRNKDNSYSEIYIHVPTNVGTTPTILFNSIADHNYHPDMFIMNSPGDPLDVEYLNGRHYDDTHPYAGMHLRAYYDLDSDLVNHGISDSTDTNIEWNTIIPNWLDSADNYIVNTNPTGIGYWWGSNQLLNGYHTDKAAYYGAKIGKGTYNGVSASSQFKTQKIYKEYTSTNLDVEYLRSTLDGVVIDFKLSNYQVAAADPTINSFAQLADSVSNADFDFNAILIYYDVYDPTTGTSVANPLVSETNLYGVYFLNKIEQTGINFIIPTITKEKPNIINRTNGNAFAYKINLKFDTSIEDVAVEKSINDYTTFGLDMFLDVLTEFSSLKNKFNSKLVELSNLKIDLESAKNALLNTNGLNALSTRLGVLEQTVSASTSAFENSAAITNLITNLNSRLNSFVAGKTSLSTSYDLAPFKPGQGISIDKTIPQQLTIASTVQAYSKVSEINLKSNNSNTFTESLGISNTYIKHSNGSVFSLSSDFDIRIDNSLNSWKNGQVLKIVFDSQIIPNNYNIKIKTRADNNYSLTIATLTAADFPISYDRTGRPIVEITCINSQNFTFQVDKIIR